MTIDYSWKDDYVTIEVADKPDHEKGGGANHIYAFMSTANGLPVSGHLIFQQGPIKECGLNGIQHIHLLKVLEHRLLRFQAGPFACAWNQAMLEHVQAAIRLDKERTAWRAAAGVEGTSQKAEGVES